MLNATFENSTAHNCLELVWRCAPKFMRTGGGAICDEHRQREPSRPWYRTTPAQKARILELAREGRLTATEIAREVGATESATYKTIERAGLRARDGRKVG